MKSLPGAISDRLRGALPKTDKSWNPPRGTESGTPPKGVHGQSLGGRKK